jgi:hypothetical protein
MRINKYVYKLLLKFQEGFDYDFEDWKIKFIEQSSLDQENNQIVITKANIVKVIRKSSSTLEVRSQFQIKILSKRMDYEESFELIEEAEDIILNILLNYKELKHKKIAFINDKSFISEQYDNKMSILTFECNDTLDIDLIKGIKEWIVEIEDTDLKVV